MRQIFRSQGVEYSRPSTIVRSTYLTFSFLEPFRRTTFFTMKASKVWATCGLIYLASTTIALSWWPTVLLAGLSLGTVAYVCGAAKVGGPAAVPVCGLTVMAALLVKIMGIFGHKAQPMSQLEATVWNWSLSVAAEKDSLRSGSKSSSALKHTPFNLLRTGKIL